MANKVLHIRSHVAESGRRHLRVYQPWYSDDMRERMRRIGSPAHFIASKWEWDYPLTPASVIELDKLAKEYSLDIVWDDVLKDYAAAELATNDYEEEVRLGIEKYIQDDELELESYITNDHGGTKPPMRHQSVVYHWALRSRGLLLAHDPGCIAGDSQITVYKDVFQHDITMAELYKMYKKGDYTKLSTYSRSETNGTRIFNEIEQVLYKGQKTTYTLLLFNGVCLEATPDHEVLTIKGWRRLDSLDEGDQVYVQKQAGNRVILNPEWVTGPALPCRDTDVYDIIMKDPHRNFIVDGVVVHNCGKTRSAVDASAGWYRAGLIRPMQQEWSSEHGRWITTGGILVACPKVVINNWAEEFAMWQGMVAVQITHYNSQKKLELSATKAHVHVINYQSLKYVLHNKYDGAIFDESHYCANHSGQTLNALQLAMQAKRRLLLTGTPVSNNLQSVFYQMLICDGGRALGPSRQKFMDEHFYTEREGGYTRTYANDKALEQISAAMSQCTYFLTKEDALDLPEQTHTPIHLDMTADQERYYEELKKDAITYIQDTSVTVEMAQSKIMKLAQLCQGFVLDDTKKGIHFNDIKTEYLLQLLQVTYPQRKVLIWARFTYEIERVCAQLTKEGIPHIRFDGSVPQGTRDKGIYSWNHDPNVRVFVGQISMGIGVNLTAKECSIPCCDTIFLGLDYRYVSWYQAVQRMHRIGQRWPCTYLYLLTTNGIDNSIYNNVLAKRETSQEVYQEGKEYFLSLLTPEAELPEVA